MKNQANIQIGFEADGLDLTNATVIDVTGEEAVSTAYRLQVSFLSARVETPAAMLLGRRAKVTMALGEAEQIHCGVIRRFTQSQVLDSGLILYRVELRPRMAVLGLSRERQIYGPDKEARVADVLRASLLGEGALGPTEEAHAGLSASDLSFQLLKDHPARSFRVQYEESDLDFITRLMEQEGIFFFFEQNENGERLIVSDDISVCQPCPGGPASIAFGQPTALTRPDRLLVTTLAAKTRRLPAKIILTEYNEAHPEVDLQVSAVVDPQGQGVVTSFDEHYLSREEGEALAKVRAAELACRKTQFRGESNAPHLCPGYRITVQEHPKDTFNRELFITKLRFEAGQPHSEYRGATQGYRNWFEALPADVVFAPERQKARPHIGGLEPAWIDGTHADLRGEIDQEGRHTARLTWDQSGRAEGKATPALRRTQPSSNANGGFHFPLSKGTEVQLSFVNGDPDRPLILGAVDNPATPGVIGDKSRTANRIRTAAGTTIEMNDGLGNGGLASDLPLALRRVLRNRLKERLKRWQEKWPEDLPKPPWWPCGPDDGDEDDAGDDDGAGETGDDDTGDATDVTTDGSSLRIYVTDSGNDNEESYLRLGSYDASVEQAAIADLLDSIPDADRNGLFITTDGAMLTAVKGDSSLYVAGNQLLTVLGSDSSPRQATTLGDESTETSQIVEIYGDQKIGVGGAATTSVAGDFTFTVEGDYTLTTNGNVETYYAGGKSSVSGKKGGLYKKGAYSYTKGKSDSTVIGVSFSCNFGVKEDVRIALYLSFAPTVIADIGARVDLRYMKFSWAGSKVETALTVQKKADAAAKAQEAEVEQAEADVCSHIAFLGI
ncbi:MAG: type VI secretion system tip protein TssI/VgrG [Pseudomonadota bacterium]